jgi:hypothetical protein
LPGGRTPAQVTFVGVVFLQTGSELLNTVLVGMSITSISSSMYILADLEQPYTGLVRVEVDIFNVIRTEISVGGRTPSPPSPSLLLPVGSGWAVEMCTVRVVPGSIWFATVLRDAISQAYRHRCRHMCR